MGCRDSYSPSFDLQINFPIKVIIICSEVAVLLDFCLSELSWNTIHTIKRDSPQARIGNAIAILQFLSQRSFPNALRELDRRVQSRNNVNHVTNLPDIDCSCRSLWRRTLATSIPPLRDRHPRRSRGFGEHGSTHSDLYSSHSGIGEADCGEKPSTFQFFIWSILQASIRTTLNHLAKPHARNRW